MNTQHFGQTGIYNWAVLLVFLCAVHLAVCYYHVLYEFQNESTLYNCLDVKKLLDQFGQIVECSFTNQAVVGSNPIAVT